MNIIIYQVNEDTWRKWNNITNDDRCIKEIIAWIVVAKLLFARKKNGLLLDKKITMILFKKYVWRRDCMEQRLVKYDKGTYSLESCEMWIRRSL